jgi:hypothetical protein
MTDESADAGRDEAPDSRQLPREGAPATVLKTPEASSDALAQCYYNGTWYLEGTEICVSGTSWECMSTTYWQADGPC